MSLNNTVIYFKGPRSSFSNLYRIDAGFEYWGHTYYSVEQAYQWRKATLHGLRKRADRILSLSDPYRIKTEGSFNTSPEWEADKARLMLELLGCKLERCAQFKQDLKLSFPKLLIENTANEYWGRGADGQGNNTLGCLLMHLRSSIE